MSDIHIPGSGPVQPLFDPNAPPSAQVNKIIFFDDLSPSERKEVLAMIYAAQNPLLIPPILYVIQPNNQVGALNSAHQVISVSSSVSSFAAQLNTAQHEIIMAMLDKWIQSVHAQAVESRKADLKRRIDGISIAFHTYQHQVNPTMDPHFPTFSVGVVLGAIGVHEALLLTPPAVLANPVAQMAQAIMAPAASQMAAGLMGSLVIFGFGLQYATAAQYAKGEGKQQVDERKFAKEYSNNVLALIGSSNFNDFLKAIVTSNSEEGKPVDDEKREEVIAKVKIILLSSALQSLYLSEYGGMSGDEFVSMLLSKSDPNALRFAEGDDKNNLIYLIRGYLTFLDNNPQNRENFIASLKAYYDSKPSLSTLADPAKVLAGVYNALPRGEIAV